MRYTRRRSNADEKIKNVFTGRRRDLDELVTVARNAWSSALRHYKDTGHAYIFLYPAVAPNTLLLLSNNFNFSLANSLWSLPPQFFLSSPSSPWSQQLQSRLSSKNAMYSFHLFSYQTLLQSGNVVLSKLLNGEFFLFFLLPGGCESVFLLLPFYSWHTFDPFI